jgi:hypothetical protein
MLINNIFLNGNFILLIDRFHQDYNQNLVEYIQEKDHDYNS